MMKFDLQYDFTEQDLVSDIDSRSKRAFARTVKRASSKAQSLAASRLDDSLPIWQGGFRVIYRSESEYVFAMEGKLAQMIEDGFAAGDLTPLIMGGQRARYNRGQQKNYVDVPIGSKSMPKKQMALNADDLLKNFTVKKYTISDLKKKSVQREVPRLVRTIKTLNSETGKKKNLIQSKRFAAGNTVFIKFARVTSSSVFPKVGFSGARVFEQVDRFVETFYEHAVRGEF